MFIFNEKFNVHREYWVGILTFVRSALIQILNEDIFMRLAEIQFFYSFELQIMALKKIEKFVLCNFHGEIQQKW